MEKLLQWSIANAQGDETSKSKIGNPDPKALAELFGAADDPSLMVEAMQVVTNPEATLEAKEIAFDNFEMLIENLDNANNIENLKLWKPLLEQLKAKDEILQFYACSVIGTATQNNDKTQKDLLNYGYLIDDILEIFDNVRDNVKTKCLYALSNWIRHNEEAYTLFNDKNGWSLIEKASKNDNEKLKLRLNSLLTSIISTGITDDKKSKIQTLFPKTANEILNSYK